MGAMEANRDGDDARVRAREENERIANDESERVLDDAAPLLGGPASASRANAMGKREFFGQPLALVPLGATEAWERFGYYAARALLATYAHARLRDPNFDVERVWGARTLAKACTGYDFGVHVDANDVGGLRVRDAAATSASARLYGTFAAASYLMPVFGGVISDAMLGAHRSAVIGATVMAVGYAGMATEWAFLLGMLAVCVGNGAFKPSMSTQLSALYDASDPRRDAGFSIFYFCINVGGFFSPLIAGTVRVYFGYEAAFASAAVGMCCALVIYASNRKLVKEATVIKDRERSVDRNNDDEEFGGATLDDDEASDEESPDGFGAKLREMSRVAQRNPSAMLAVGAVCAAGVGFSVVYEQQGSTMMLFSDEHVDLHGLPTEFVAALNPLFVLVFTPAVTRLWDWQARRDAEPHQMTKFAIGCALLAMSFVVLMFGALPIDSHASPMRVSVLWIVLTQMLLTLGELFSLPVALSYVSKIAPHGLLSALIGLWFGSSFFGNYFSGILGSTYPEFSTPSAFFAALAAIAGGVAVVLLIASARLRRTAPG